MFLPFFRRIVCWLFLFEHLKSVCGFRTAPALLWRIICSSSNVDRVQMFSESKVSNLGTQARLFVPVPFSSLYDKISSRDQVFYSNGMQFQVVQFFVGCCLKVWLSMWWSTVPHHSPSHWVLVFCRSICYIHFDRICHFLDRRNWLIFWMRWQFRVKYTIYHRLGVVT